MSRLCLGATLLWATRSVRVFVRDDHRRGSSRRPVPRGGRPAGRPQEASPTGGAAAAFACYRI